jgi:long-chain fatty acid transport protein
MKKILVVLLILIAPAAFATNGYFTHGQGTTSKAMAGANTAIAQEALDAESNPAAAAFIPSGYSFSLALFSPDRSYTVTGAPSGYPQTFGLAPGTVTSKSKYFPMPALGFNIRPTDRDAIAVNLVARGGMNTDYRTSTFYGGDHTGVDLAQVFLTTTYARKITQNQSLGITAVIAGQRFKASGLQAFAAFSSDPNCLTNNGYDTSYGFGARLGYLAHITPQFSFGAAYSPQIEMSKLQNYCGLFAQDGRFDIPASASAGIAYTVAQLPVTFAADWQQIQYSKVHSVGNPLFPNLMTSPLGAATGAGFGWHDVNVAKIGVQWKATDTFTWRAGFSKADQPIPSSEVLFNILAPGVVEKHFTFGGTKTLNDRGKFHFALMYAPNKTVTGANPLEAPGQQTISLKMHEWEAEFGYTFGF